MLKIEKIYEKYTNYFLIDVKIESKSEKISNHPVYFEFDASTDGEASVCTIRWVADCYDKSGKFGLNSGFKDVKIGSKISVSAGYHDGNYKNKHLVEIFRGFIFSYSIKIQDRVSYLEISGIDAKVFLMANRVTKFKSEGQKYSKIVTEILKNYSSKSSGNEVNIAEEPNNIRPELHQRNESDFEYLRRIADITGSLFYVVNGKFMFISSKFNSSADISISPFGIINSDNIINSIQFRSNFIGIPKKMSVRFIGNEEYSKEPKPTDVKSSKKIGSGKTADELTNSISDINTFNIIDFAIDSAESAKFAANSLYRKKSLNFVTCEITCKFLPDAKIGSSVKISGFSNPINNNYIITYLNHKYDGSNFKTTMKLSADSFNQL